MYQQGYCTAYCVDHSKHCDPRIRYMLEYPSPCYNTAPDFNKHVFPKEKYDSGAPLCRKKLRKRRRCKSLAAGSDCLLQMSCAMPQGACPILPPDPCCKKLSDYAKRKGGGCERVQETCTEFMEIVQEAVQDTVQQCAKAQMEELFKKITCKIDELACQMKEVKEVVTNVGTKNDLRFKCICEFLFAHLKPAMEARRSSNAESRNEFCNEPTPKPKSNGCCCKHCLAKRALENLSPKKTKSQTSQKSEPSMSSMWPKMQSTHEAKKCCSCKLRKKPSSYSMKSNNDDTNCENDYMAPNVSSYSRSTHAAHCQCPMCCKARSREKKQASKMCCCNKRPAPSPPPRPCRREGGMSQVGFVERWTARDYKPSPARTQTLSEHCSRLEALSKQTSVDTKMSFPEILIDEPLSPPNGFKDTEDAEEGSSDTDCAEKSGVSEKTLCSSSNYCH